jgi:hypothetical protein
MDQGKALMNLTRAVGAPLLGVVLSLSSVNVLWAASITGTASSTIVGQYSSGDAFPLGGADVPQMSRLVFEIGSCGPMIRSHWHDPTGLIVAAEELETGDAGFVRYRYWKPNVEESAVVTRSGPKTLAIEINRAGRKESREVEVDGEIAAGPLAVLAQSSLVKLKDGDKVPVHYLVPSKFAAYPFNLARTDPAQASRIGVSFTGDSYSARQFAKGLTMYFDANGEFEGMRGPSVPAISVPQGKQTLDLDVMVNRHYSRPCSPAPVASPRELAD